MNQAPKPVTSPKTRAAPVPAAAVVVTHIPEGDQLQLQVVRVIDFYRKDSK